MSFICSSCGKNFTRRNNLTQHIRIVHDKVRRYCCDICGRPFARNYNLQQHILSHTGVRQQPVSCSPPKRQRLSDPVLFKEKHISHFRRIQCYTLSTAEPLKDLWTLYKKTKDPLRELLSERLLEQQLVKFDLILLVSFHKATDHEETISCYFHSRSKRTSTHRQLADLILEAFKNLNKQVEDYLQRGAGWVIKSIDEFDIHVSKYCPIRGSSYLPLPKKLQCRKAIVNIKNNDNKCFMWSLLAALHPVEKNPERIRNYQQYQLELNFEDISFPVAVDDIAKFETQNNLSINLYGYTDEQDEIKVLHITENPGAPKRVSLLLYNQQHYCWIKNPDGFLRAENGKTNKQYQCHKCLKLFYSLQKRDKHITRCQEPDLDVCEMPEENLLTFANFHKMQRLPYAIYADFECLLEKMDTCLPKDQQSHTTAYQRHTSCGYAIAEVYGCCSDSVKLGETSIFRGNDAVQKFLDHLISWGERYQHLYNQQVTMEMDQQDAWQFAGTSVCNICKVQLGQDRVADHCQFCGCYRGACHSSCNIQYRLPGEVVVILHNLRRYDGHLLLEKLGQAANSRKSTQIRVIPKGMDDYLTFSLRLRYNKTGWLLKFVDSYQFLNAPLAKLVDNLHDKGSNKFTNMASHFTPQQLPSLLRKGVYPYDYMDNWHRFDEQQLPPLEQFKSTLTGEDISESDYQHAQHVWDLFKYLYNGCLPRPLSDH